MTAARTLVLGDAHGAARAVEQVLDRAGFDPSRDRLVSLGDVCDGWPEVDRVLDLLLDLDDIELILGNHDTWALTWIQTGRPPQTWASQGGQATLRSYARRARRGDPLDNDAVAALAREVPAEHRELLETASPFLIERRPDGRRVLYTHAGWRRGTPPEEQDDYHLRWGRDLWIEARVRNARAGDGDPPRLTDFDAVFLGHTPTQWTEPRPVLELWNLDQGAGWDGVLTLMDADTQEWWQSDPVPDLYPGERGRG
jgi:serine/threonine protein phosphatase 1